MTDLKRLIDERTRAALGENAARAGEIAARKLFAARGDVLGEAQLNELELALVAAAAAHVALSLAEGRASRWPGCDAEVVP